MHTGINMKLCAPQVKRAKAIMDSGPGCMDGGKCPKSVPILDTTVGEEGSISLLMHDNRYSNHPPTPVI